MVATVPALIFVLSAAASASGTYLSHSRYNSYYGNFKEGEFFSNSIAGSNYDAQGWATFPSATQVDILDNVNYAAANRRDETHIFSGRIRVPRCKAGVYKFRLTSDDASHLLIDRNIVVSNPGKHGMKSVERTVVLGADHDHAFELWWGNVNGPSGFKLEYCYHQQATQKMKELSILEEDTEKLLADMDVSDWECHMTEDLSKIMVPHDVAGVKRCDYEGYYADNLDFFKNRTPSTKLLPGGCSTEVGGRISGWDKPGHGAFYAGGMSFSWEATLKPENSGQHLFWTRCNDACHVVITPPGERPVTVVDNGGKHTSTNRQGRIFLEKGVEYSMVMYWGNVAGVGDFKLMYQDPAMAQLSDTLLSVLV